MNSDFCVRLSGWLCVLHNVATCTPKYNFLSFQGEKAFFFFFFVFKKIFFFFREKLRHRSANEQLTALLVHVEIKFQLATWTKNETLQYRAINVRLHSYLNPIFAYQDRVENYGIIGSWLLFVYCRFPSILNTKWLNKHLIIMQLSVRCITLNNSPAFSTVLYNALKCIPSLLCIIFLLWQFMAVDLLSFWTCRPARKKNFF